MRTFSDIIDRWPDPAPVTFAEDIGEEPGTCRQWRNRDTIPSRVWRKTVAAAQRRKIDGVTYELLAAIAEKQREATEAASSGSSKTQRNGSRAGASAPARKSTDRRASSRGSKRAA